MHFPLRNEHTELPTSPERLPSAVHAGIWSHSFHLWEQLEVVSVHKIRFTKPPQEENNTSEACTHMTMVLQEFMNYQWSATTLWTLNWFLRFFLPSPRVKHINATCKSSAAGGSEVHTKVSVPHPESKSAFQNWGRQVHRQQVNEWVPKGSGRTRPSLVPGRSGCWWRSRERCVGCVQACRLPLSIILITPLGYMGPCSDPVEPNLLKWGQTLL